MRWSLRLRLTAAFVAVTVIAVAAVSLQVLPPLRSSMSQQRLRALVTQTRTALAEASARAARAERDARPPATPPRGDRRRAAAQAAGVAADRRLVDAVALRTGARVVLLAPGGEDGALSVLAGTRGRTVTTSDAAIGRRSLDARVPAFDIAERGGEGFRVRVAMPVAAARVSAAPGAQRVLVASESLADVDSAVSLVRRRVLAGGALGILVAFVAGALVAVGVSTRLRRLELGSREVAAGRFTTRFNVDARDELGSLARSLDTMQRQLAELDQGRKRFIATASHELRTPLQSLSGFVELLRDEELDEETRRAFLDRLSTQITRLTRLSGDLLDLSRLESGGVDLRPENTDLHALAERVAAEFGPVVEREGRALEVRLVGAPVVQSVDPDRVEQLLRILIDNAIKHAGAGHRVEVRVSRSRGSAELAVSDDGPGVDPGDVPHLFEPFHGRGDGSGAGLGLAIARELAHRMRGTLDVASEPGRTTFTLRLPA